MSSLQPRKKRGHASAPPAEADLVSLALAIPGDSFLESPAQPVLFEFAPAPVLAGDQHPAAVYLASLAQGSRRAQRTALEIIAQVLSGGALTAWHLPWAQLRHQHTAAVRASLASRYAVTTARRMLAALKGTLRAAWRLGQIPTREYMRAIDLPAIRGQVLPAGRALDEEEVDLLFGACDRDASGFGARDAAILVALLGAGLRRSEAWALDVADYNRRKSALRIRSGKGNKERIAFLADGSDTRLDSWLDLRGDWPGPLFCRMRAMKKGSAKVYQSRLSQNAMLDVLIKRAGEAGIERLSPHDLRRTFITLLLKEGADVVSVQRLAGHQNVSTTARYDRRGEEEAQKTAVKLHLPSNSQKPKTEPLTE